MNYLRIKKYLVEGISELYSSPGHNLKALDGLRALAILLVVCMHVNELFISPESIFSPSILNQIPPFKGGWIGVPLFFVLSGFLIGGQLWKELIQTNTIKFGRFILRRGFRIWPIYYFVVFIVYFFSISRSFDLNGLFSNIFFLSNYYNDDGPVLGAWSLATEEHFYIIAPLLLIIASRYLKNEYKSYRPLLWFLFILPTLNRFLYWNIFNSFPQFDLNIYMKNIYRPLHTHSEGLIAGMLIANYYQDKESHFHKLKDLINYLLPLSLFIMAISYKSKVIFNFTGISIGFSALLIYALIKDNWLTSILSSKFLYVISKTSFAIYLIHIHVIRNLVHRPTIKLLAVGHPILETIWVLIFVLFYSVLISSILYLMVEKPFMILRSKYLH